MIGCIKKMELFKNKKGYSTGFAWIFALVSLFGLGIMYIVFNQVFTAHLVPIIKEQVNQSYSYGGIDNTTRAEVYAGIDKYMAFFHILPFILFFVIVIYMIVSAVRKERESEFG